MRTFVAPFGQRTDRRILARSRAERRDRSLRPLLDAFSGARLEDRTLLSTVSNTSGNYFYIDSGRSYSGEYLTSGYVSTKFTNTDAKTYTDVWAQIGNFTGGVLQQPAGASNLYHVGPVVDGASASSFFYLSTPGTTGTATTTPQGYTVTYYDGVPSDGKPIASTNVTINAIQDLIAAAANKITGSSISLATIYVGDSFDVTLTGQTGTIGTNNDYAMYFTPASFPDFPSVSVQLLSTSISFSGGLTGTYDDMLLIPSADAAANTGAADYTATYHFKALAPTTHAEPISPIAYIASGSNNVKHNDVDGLSLIPIIQLGESNPPVITTTSVPNWTVNQSYDTILSATGGTAPLIWQLSGGALPTGMVLNSNGGITGAPTATGTYTFQAQVYDQNGLTSIQSYTFTINAAPTITAPTTLPGGTVGTKYPDEQVTLTGGTTPYSHYTISAGALPTGLTLNPTTGLLTGTPTESGTYSFTIQARDSAGAKATKDYTNLVISPAVPLSIVSPTSLPAWTVNQTYPDQQITPTGGLAPYGPYSLVGTLPNGMTFDSTTGVLKGTSTVAGGYPIAIGVYDSAENYTIRNYTLTINPAPYISSPDTLPNWTTDQPYPGATVQVAYGTTPYSEFVVATGSLPTGLTLDPESGAITGTPTETGTYEFRIQTTDAAGAVAFKDYVVVIDGPPEIVSPDSLPNWTEGTPYPTTTFVVQGGTGPYSYFIVLDGKLPEGMTLDWETGVLSGTPTETGTFSFLIQAEDSTESYAYRPYSLTIAPPPVIVAPTGLPNWTIGIPYPDNQVTLEGGTGAYSNYIVTAGSFPTGVTLDPDTGLISGTPTYPGVYTVTVQAQDEAGATASKTYEFTINTSPMIVSPTVMPSWTVNRPYPNEPIVAVSGTPGYSNYQVIAGALPTGLTLDPNTGVISGTPTVTGTFNVTVCLQDSVGAKADRAYRFTINAAPVITGPTTFPDWTQGQPYPAQLIVASGGTPGYSNYRVSSGTLPFGITIDPETGLVSGIPQSSGPVSFDVSVNDAAGSTATRHYGFTVNPPPVVVAPVTLPNWTVNQNYPAQQVVLSLGTPGYSHYVVVSGSLPEGLSLDSFTGRLAGTPTVVGTFSPVIQGSDSTGASASRPYTFTINAAPTIVGPDSFGNWTVNREYPETTIVAAGGTPSYVSYEITGGSLPVGMFMNRMTGQIMGTPQFAGPVAFDVMVTDSTGATALRHYSFVVNGNPDLISPTTLPAWTVDRGYPSTQLVVVGGTPGYSNYIVFDGNLPAGLTLDKSTGLLSGTPTETGLFVVTLQASDSAGATSSRAYTLVINPPPIIAGPSAIPDWTMSRPFTPTPFVIQGGTPGYSDFRVVEGALPDGMSIDPATGILSGTPNVTGSFSILVQATDSTGATAARSYSFVVNSPFQPVIVNPGGSEATAGKPFEAQAVVPDGGTGPFHYVLVAGSLPRGVLLDPNTGLVSGTPTGGQAGTYPYTVMVTDSTGYHASAESSIRLAYFSISGLVYYDYNRSRTVDSVDYGIAGVYMMLDGLIDGGGSVHLATRTDAGGFYVFPNLFPGAYTVTRAATQAVFKPEVANPGSTGGVAQGPMRIADIVLQGAAVDSVMNNFGNVPLPNCRIQSVAATVGAQYQRILKQRAADPAAFDAAHPRMVPFLNAGQVPWGIKPFQTPPPLILQYVPTMGTLPFQINFNEVKPAPRAVPRPTAALKLQMSAKHRS